MLVLEHAAFGPAHIAVRHLLQRDRHRLDDEVVDRELVERLLFLVLGRRRVDLLARGEQLADVAVDGEIEGRNGLRRRGQALRDGAAHAVMRHDLVGALFEQREDLLVGHRRRDARAPRRGAAAGAFRPLPDLALSTSRAMTRPCGPRAVDAARARCRLPWRDAAPAARRRCGRGRWLAAPAQPPAARSCSRCSGWRAAASRRGAAAGAGAAAALRPWQALRSAFAAAAAARARRLHILAVAGEHRDHIVDRNVLRAFGHQDLRDRALVDRLDFHGRLVGLDLRDHVAGLDLVALFLEPLGKVALFHRRRQRGHQNVDWHCQ